MDLLLDQIHKEYCPNLKNSETKKKGFSYLQYIVCNMTMKRVILRFASVRWVLMLCISLTIIVYFCLIGKLHIISRHNNLISNNILTFSKKVKSKERFHTDYKSQQYSDYMKYLTLVPGSSLASTWIVNARDGVSVFNSKSGHLEIIDILPFGSIVFEEIVHEDAIFISFPIHGWIYATRWTDGDRYMSSNQTSLISNIPSTTTSLTKLTVVQPIHTIKSRAMTRSHGLQICASVKYLEDTDVLNGDLGVNPATVTSAQDCCFLCALEKPCSAFTYTHNGECWLKHISPTTQIQPKPRQVSSTDPSISKPSPPELISGLLTTKVTTTSVAKSTAAIPEINNKKLSTTCCSFSEAGSLSLRGHWSDTHVVSSSPFVLQLEKSSIDWTEQWPIGNGRTGALIGGLLDVEVIPFSIAGLYSHRQPPRSNLDSEIEKVTQNVPLINPLNPAVPIVATPTRAELFHTARQQLSNGQIEEAQESAAGLENGDFPLGRFEYVADLVLLFSSSPILPRIIDPSVQEKPGVVPPVQPQDEPGIGGRAALIQRMKEQLKSVDSDSALTTLGSPLKSNSILDMRRGIVHTTFLENVADAGSDEASDSANEEGDGRDKENIVNSDNESKNEMSSVSTNSIIVRAHSREWFSSTVEDVTVGRMRCSTNVHFPPRNSTALSGCLNLFLATNRDPSYTDGKPLVTTHVEEASNSPIGRLIQDSAKSAGSTRIFALDLSLQSSPGIFVPTTCMCGLIVCHIPNVGFTDTSGLHTLPDGTAGVICNGADTVDVITSVQIGKEPSDGGPDESSIASLKSDCWQHVFSAAESGFSALRKQHIDWFSERMAQTDVQFESSNSSQACPDTPLRDRLGSLGDGCQEAGKTTLVNHSLDISLLAQSFQFSRYLLFSSATRSVNNLQGIWADGKSTYFSNCI